MIVQYVNAASKANLLTRIEDFRKTWRALDNTINFLRWSRKLHYILSPLYYKTGSIRCLGLHFSDRTVRLIEIFVKISNQVV